MLLKLIFVSFIWNNQDINQAEDQNQQNSSKAEQNA